MRTRRLIACALLALLSTVGTSAAVAWADSADPAPPRVFVAIAHLSGEEEVPPLTDTDGSGVAIYRLDRDGQTLHYILVATNLTTNPTAAHIHGPAPTGTNAGVVAFLFPPNDRSSCSRTTATLLRCKGDITGANLVGTLAGHPLSELLDQMAAGNTYTNVHTMKHPGGEIRGQNTVVANVP